MKRLCSHLGFLLKNENGGVLILVTLLIVVLLGVIALVVDVGILYQARRQMVNAADSGALAGAQELIYNPGKVEEVATNFTLHNFPEGYEDRDYKVTVAPITDNSVTVETERNIPLAFARFLPGNFTDDYVGARATAVIRPLTKAVGLAPFAVVYSEYEAGQEVIIKYGKHDEAEDMPAGNHHILDLGGQLKDTVENGSSLEIKVGDWVGTDPGNKLGNINPPLQNRFDTCGQGDGDHWDDETGKCGCGKVCDRVMNIIIFDDVKLKPGEQDYKPGSTEIRVAAFATVYMLHRPSNSDKEITARFIKMIGQSEAIEGGSLGDFGLYKVVLIE